MTRPRELGLLREAHLLGGMIECLGRYAVRLPGLLHAPRVDLSDAAALALEFEESCGVSMPLRAHLLSLCTLELCSVLGQKRRHPRTE